MGLTPGNLSILAREFSGRFERNANYVPFNRSTVEEIVGYRRDGSVRIRKEGSFCEVGWTDSGPDDISQCFHARVGARTRTHPRIPSTLLKPNDCEWKEALVNGGYSNKKI